MFVPACRIIYWFEAIPTYINVKIKMYKSDFLENFDKL